MIRFENVTFSYGLRPPVVRELTLTVPEGGRLCLTGVSGQGKTTVLRLLLGLEKPRRGVVTVPDGTRFSAVFQEDRLLPWKTALENVALFSDGDTACRLLAQLGLAQDSAQLPAALSGGMKRRVALARALAHPFEVLVLDEVLTGLDSETKARCLSVIHETVGGRTLVMASHDPTEATALHADIYPLP